MTCDSILTNIARNISLEPEEVRLFESHLGFRELRKKETLLQEGQLCKAISFVDQGALRAYCLDKHGRESTIMFAFPDWWVTDMYCFINRKPAMMFIEALEYSCVFQLTRDGLDELFTALPKFEKLFRILMQNAYTREQLRTIENLTLTAEERYDRFLEKYPKVAQQVPQKQIASYLGITPEFLSTIRKNKSRASRS
jgi:CRP-like cAMP-binding protein